MLVPYNLRTRRRLLRRDVPGQEGAVYTKLFITDRGHVAWIEGDLAAPPVAGPCGNQPPPIRLMVFANGKLKVAAAGLLDAVSLGLTGRQLHWMQTGVEHSVRL